MAGVLFCPAIEHMFYAKPGIIPQSALPATSLEYDENRQWAIDNPHRARYSGGHKEDKMNNYFFDYPDSPDYWDILIHSGLTMNSSPQEIRAAIEQEARKRGLTDDEIETAITNAFDNISSLS